MSVWINDTAARLNAGPYGTPIGARPYLPANAASRLERIRQARMLYKGDHAAYFLGEGRAQLPFRAVRLAGKVCVPYVKYNALKLATNKTVDLIFGAEPLLKATDTRQAAALAALVKRTHLHRLLSRTARECCYEGEAFIEAIRLDGQIYLQRLQSHTVFPIGRLRPDGQYSAYESYLEDDLAPEAVRVSGASIPVVLITRWSAGRIERSLWQLDGQGRLANRLPLAAWPAYAAAAARGEPVPAEVVETGIPECTVTYIANEDMLDQAVSDYDGLIELQDLLNHKITQTATAIAKNQDPKLAVPATAGGADGNAAVSSEVYFFNDPDHIPQYITWDAPLESALKDRQFGLQGLLINAEISPVLVGLKEGAAPTAYKTLRLEAQNSLSMASRKSVNWTPAVQRMVRVAQMLELASGLAGYPLGDVGVELRDGLPIDRDEQANTISTKRSAGVLSVEGALEEIHGGDVAAAQTELARLRGESRIAADEAQLMTRSDLATVVDEDSVVDDGSEEVAA